MLFLEEELKNNSTTCWMLIHLDDLKWKKKIMVSSSHICKEQILDQTTQYAAYSFANMSRGRSTHQPQMPSLCNNTAGATNWIVGNQIILHLN